MNRLTVVAFLLIRAKSFANNIHARLVWRLGLFPFFLLRRTTEARHSKEEKETPFKEGKLAAQKTLLGAIRQPTLRTSEGTNTQHTAKIFPTDNQTHVFVSKPWTISLTQPLVPLPSLQETYDQPRLLSYLSTDLAIICYSVTSPQSLQDIPGKWIPELRRFSPTTPFVMVGLKTDARNENEHHRISQISSSSSGSTDSTGSFESQNEDEIMPWMLDYDEEIEIVDRKTAKKIARANGALAHVECSAKTGQSVDLLFQEILPRVLEHHRPRNRKRRSLVRRLGRFLHVRTTDATEAGTKL